MAEPSSPPSFDAIFSSQQDQRRSSSSNSSSFNPYAFQPTYNDGNGTSQVVADQLVEEPHHIRRSSTTSSYSKRDSITGPGAGIADMMARGFNLDGRRPQSLKHDSQRQDSFPFNPAADSTIIATAPGNTNNAGFASTPIGDIVYGRNSTHSMLQHQQQLHHQPQPQAGPSHLPWGMDDGSVQQIQYTSLSNQQYSPYHSPLPTAASIGSNLEYMPQTASSINDSVLYDHMINQAPPPQRNWSQDFIGQGDIGQGYINNAVGDTQVFEEMVNQQEQNNDQDAVINELQRIISNTSHDGSPFYSREPSPFATIQSHLQQQADPSSASHSQMQYQRHSVSSSHHHQRTDSLTNSRTGSPFTDMSNAFSPAPSFQRGGSSPSGNSPFFNKPQSPPALIIPNQHSPSPKLPPIVTTAAGPSGPPQPQVSGPRRGDLGGSVMGGLLPPTNPALEHLTGMAGISPIAPNADGPMIYIQPSTPISGLKDGRGLFDAALRRAGQLTQANHSNQLQGSQGQPTGFSVPQLPTGSLSHPSSHDQLMQGNQNSGQPQNNLDFAAIMASLQTTQDWAIFSQNTLPVTGGQTRPRAKSDSFMPSPTADSFDRQALFQMLGGTQPPSEAIQTDNLDQWKGTVNAWRSGIMDNDGNQVPNQTLDPRMLPGGANTFDALQQFIDQRQKQHQQQPTNMQGLNVNQQHQLSQLQAQRNRLPPLNTNTNQSNESGQAVFKYEPGEFSPTSMAFYQSIGMFPHSASELPGTTSAPFYTTTFGDLSQTTPLPATAGPSQQTFLRPTQEPQAGRRKSYGGSGSHPASGAGTPGYGAEFTKFINTLPFNHLKAGAVRGPTSGHRRAAKSEDLGKSGTVSGWGVGGGGSTADFLQSITANDGSLLPPTNRGRAMSHSRNSSASSARSASPALSISSQGSSLNHTSPRMDLPDGVQIPQLPDDGKVAKLKVTSVATEVASTSRRTNNGVFVCPVPGCGSTFTRHFNLKGHLRSHNDERPYKCPYDGCPKAVIGFARQHDCKRHMLLHEGLRPFECEGCGKKFARLDALTRHHKSEQGQECAITHPLPTNMDGTPMSESQYKAYKGIGPTPGSGSGRRRSGGNGVKEEQFSAEEEEGMEGMDDYDIA